MHRKGSRKIRIENVKQMCSDASLYPAFKSTSVTLYLDPIVHIIVAFLRLYARARAGVVLCESKCISQSIIMQPMRMTSCHARGPFGKITDCCALTVPLLP